MTIYCECDAPIIDVEHDAGCRRCGRPVDFNPRPDVTAYRYDSFEQAGEAYSEAAELIVRNDIDASVIRCRPLDSAYFLVVLIERETGAFDGFDWQGGAQHELGAVERDALLARRERLADPAGSLRLAHYPEGAELYRDGSLTPRPSGGIIL